jgi:hypothetical protein
VLGTSRAAHRRARHTALIEGENMMKKLGVAIPVLAIALGGTTACATKKFVRTNVGEVNE